MNRTILGLLASLALGTQVQAQTACGTMPPSTLCGRLSINPGPAQAIPISTLAVQLLAGETPIADVNYPAVATDRSIVYNTLTASRTITLPSASTVAAGTRFYIYDRSGNAASTVTLSVAPTGTDLINGANTSLAVVGAPFGYALLESDGNSKWISGIGTQLSPGVGGNVLRNLAVSGNVLTTDCSKTINLTGSNTALTFPAVAGFATTCSVDIVNASATRGQQIAGLTGITKLYPLKSFTAKIVNGAWTLFNAPGRYLVPNGGSLTLFANNSATGCSGAPCSNANDCLAATTACATFNQIMTDAATNIDNEGTVAYQIATGTTWTNTPFLIQQTLGTGSNILVGDNVAAPSVLLTCNVNCGSTTNNCLICFERIRGKWQILGFATTTTGAATTTSHIIVQGSELTLQFANIAFGVVTGSADQITCQYGSSVDNIGNYTIVNGVTGTGSHANSMNSCVIHLRTGTVTIAGTPAFSPFVKAHNVGIIGITAGTFSGAATGVRCISDGNSVIDAAGTAATLPGNSACTTASGGQVL